MMLILLTFLKLLVRLLLLLRWLVSCLKTKRWRLLLSFFWLSQLLCCLWAETKLLLNWLQKLVKLFAPIGLLLLIRCFNLWLLLRNPFLLMIVLLWRRSKSEVWNPQRLLRLNGLKLLSRLRRLYGNF